MSYLRDFLDRCSAGESRGPVGASPGSSAPASAQRLVVGGPPDFSALGTAERRGAVAAAWAGALERVREAALDAWPRDGLAELRRISPQVAGDVDAAEGAVEKAAVEYIAGGSWAMFGAALAAWVQAHLQAVRIFATTCVECGASAPVAAVDVDGYRRCSRCHGGRR